MSTAFPLPDPVRWEHRPTTDFPPSAGGMAILPVHGLADLGLGLGWDAETALAGALLADSIGKLATPLPLTVLPPVHLSLAPYQPALSRTDPETFHDVIRELATGIKPAGFTKLVFWSSHPWNTEVIDVVSRDVRIEMDLQTFVVELGGLGLSLHPRFPAQRARARRLAAFISGGDPITEPAGDPVDPGFRPGNWSRLPPLPAPDSTADAATILAETAERLAGLWQEIWARPGFTASRREPVASKAATTPPIPPPRIGLAARLGTEMRALAAAQNPLVVLPIGAIEQHGPHLPVGVDTMIADAAATGLKSRLGDAIEIMPALAYGKSNEHADFPGTVGISARSLRRILKDRVRNLHALGFRQFAVLNTHGGNSSVLTYTLRELQTELGVRAGMLRLPVSAEIDEQERTWGFHAGEWETSVMLAIAPDLVRMDRAVCHYPATLDDAGELRPENAPAIYSWKTQDIASNGVMGDATKATAAKGQRWLDEALDAVAAQIRGLDGS